MSVALKPQRTSKTDSNSWNEGSQSLFFHRQIDDEVQQKDRRKNHEKDLPNAIHSPAKWYELLCHPRAGVAKTERITCGPECCAAAEFAIH
jgi:hypothetical protein